MAEPPVRPARPNGGARPLAVIDIGSNSARVVVYVRDDSGSLQIRSTTRSALRLVRDVDEKHRLSPEAMERAFFALQDFRAIAAGAGASRIVAVATAAMRDAKNGGEFVERVRRELGIEIEVIDGALEAEYGLAGGLQGLPVKDGLLFDLGGGSMQVIRFADRVLVRSWSFPLGALRLSRAFLKSDPPSPAEVRRLVRHVRETLEGARIGALGRGEQLVGTGGTVRNVAKMDRRGRDYPVSRVHGYTLPRTRLHRLAAAVTERSQRKRESMPGLSGERGDSIAGGALAIDTLASLVGASTIVVAGQGVREGLAARALGVETWDVAAVRAASLASLAARFATGDEDAARRRAAVAQQLLEALDPRATEEVREALSCGAHILDIGRAVDFFSRHAHAADILLATELAGFSHREIALASAVVRNSGDEDSGHRRYSPLLQKEDGPVIVRAGALLKLADDIEERCPPGAAIRVGVTSRGAILDLSVSTLAGWRPRGVEQRVKDAFGRAIRVRASS